MSQSSDEVYNWIFQRRIVAGRELAALRTAGQFPDALQWRRFLDQLLLWLAVIACGASLVFFIAFNWQELGRYAKFGIVELAIVLSLCACWYFDLDGLPGKACLVLTSIFVGVLLALVGQTYQTGADTYELFSAWAIAITAWVLLARLGAFYLFWLALFNVAISLYYATFGGFFGFLFGWHEQLFLLFSLNTCALLLWEILAWRGVGFLQERWSARVLALASGALITALVLQAVFADFHTSRKIVEMFSVLIYPVWGGIVYWAYRYYIRDLFVLAGAVLSVVVVFNSILVRVFLHESYAGSFLLVGMSIIGTSAWGGIWLKNVDKEMQA
jgi:uncharacterized membrane protein